MHEIASAIVKRKTPPDARPVGCFVALVALLSYCYGIMLVICITSEHATPTPVKINANLKIRKINFLTFQQRARQQPPRVKHKGAGVIRTFLTLTFVGLFGKEVFPHSGPSFSTIVFESAFEPFALFSIRTKFFNSLVFLAARGPKSKGYGRRTSREN